MSSVLVKGHDIARPPLRLRLRARKEVKLRLRWRLRRERQMRHRRPTTLKSTRSPRKKWTPESRGIMELKHHQLYGCNGSSPMHYQLNRLLNREHLVLQPQYNLKEKYLYQNRKLLLRQLQLNLLEKNDLLEKYDLLDLHDPLKKDLVLLNLKKVLQKNQNETLQ